MLEGFIDYSAVMKPGVYALVRRGVVVYIGKSKKPMIRISAHLYGNRQMLISQVHQGNNRIKFDEVWIQSCGLQKLDDLERKLIKQYKPKHNVVHNPKSTQEAGKTFLQSLIETQPKPKSTTQVFRRM